ncbi:hypothetical protein SDC9_81179 [bioreactor metagenome]|uniref:Uncharacterized protein n=1 Tax=bioreactor metagenome TaxID=1076179 RepID=A0A644Z795_9ZZZZ
MGRPPFEGLIIYGIAVFPAYGLFHVAGDILPASLCVGDHGPRGNENGGEVQPCRGHEHPGDDLVA